MRVACTAYDRSGRQVLETIDAATVDEASEALRRRGLFVTEAAEEKVLEPDARWSERVPTARGLGARGRLRHVSGLARQMSVLVSTGTPIVEALGSMERQAKPGTEWERVLKDVRRRVEEGASLSKAMEAHPQHFDAVARSLVSAGEEGGKLDAMLERLARLTRQQVKIRGQITSAMIYPCLLICISMGVVATMLGFVLPRFQGMFESLGATLPPTTKALLATSAWLRSYWPWVVGGLAAGGGSTGYWLMTEAGRRWLDGMVIRVPLIGMAARSFATARLCRVIGTLVEGKVPLLDTLQLAREAAGNAVYENLVSRAARAVERGDSMSTVFASSGLVPVSVCEALRSGEKSARLGPVLVTLADALDEDNEVAVKTLTALLEPMILLTLGLVVGTMAMSMFLPLFDLTAAAGGPGPGGGGGGGGHTP